MTYRYRATSADGTTRLYSHKPQQGKSAWVRNGLNESFIVESEGEPCENWRDTLEEIDDTIITNNMKHQLQERFKND